MPESRLKTIKNVRQFKRKKTRTKKLNSRNFEFVNNDVFFEAPVKQDKNEQIVNCLVTFDRILQHPHLSGSGDHVNSLMISQIAHSYLKYFEPKVKIVNH
eukprot:UN32039